MARCRTSQAQRLTLDECDDFKCYTLHKKNQSKFLTVELSYNMSQQSLLICIYEGGNV